MFDMEDEAFYDANEFLSPTVADAVSSSEQSCIPVDSPSPSSDESSSMFTALSGGNDDPIASSPPVHGIRRNARQIRDKALAKSQRAIDSLKSDNRNYQCPKDQAVINLETDPAFNAAQLDDLRHARRRSSIKAKKVVADVLAAAVHPISSTRETVKRQAAKEISQAQRPYLSAEDDRALVEAHDALERSRSRNALHSSDEDVDETTTRQCRIHEIEDHRESLRVAWAVARHTDRVRVVEHRQILYPRKERFQEKDDDGQSTRFDYGSYVGHLVLYYTRGFTAQYIDDFNELPFDIDTLSRTIERLVMASAPWQAYYMNLRRIYRWEDPRRTGFWLLVWLVLWRIQHIGTFIYGYVILTLLRERYFPSSVEGVRAALDRAIDRTQPAHAWNEVVDQHGSKNWIEPFLEAVGPQAQLQLSDLADLMEILANLYYWRRPKQTAASTFFYICCFSVTLFTDIDFSMRVAFFVGIFIFFFCWPISSRYPKYRHLVDPVRWIYWDIPTHSELSLWDLQKRATIQQMDVDSANADGKGAGSMDGTGEPAPGHAGSTGPAAPLHPATESFEFRAIENSRCGRLFLTREDISFRRGRKTVWVIAHINLIEVYKRRASNSATVMSLGRARHQITFMFTNDEGKPVERSVEVDQADRDEIFSVVIGWSGRRWKSLRARDRTKEAKI